MKRGEIWTVAGAKDYAGKPRPAVILQDDRFDATGSVTVCLLTTDRGKLGSRIGEIDADDAARLNRAVILFLNLIETS